MLHSLEITNIGPAKSMSLEFGKRLNILTGDNGLGKSFLLDIAWWAMTRKWPAEVNKNLTSGRIALPTDKKKKATIISSFEASSKHQKISSQFVAESQSWKIPQGRPASPGLVFYAMADGSFAVWDFARNYWKSQGNDTTTPPPAYVFSAKEVWDGLQDEKGNWLCNGLIRDWASWQKENGKIFEVLKSVLKVLSPSGDESIRPGALTRISLTDARDMPTITTGYGQDVALVHASSGMRRIITLAYFLVWCVDEHVKINNLKGKAPEKKAVFLLDEIESHLHPKWQRSIIKSLLSVLTELNLNAELQLIVATHSPLVMASVEPLFDKDQDAWFDIDCENGEVNIVDRPFGKLGDISNWLTSEAFNLSSAYSLDAEKAIENASKVLSKSNATKEEVLTADEDLQKFLSDIDPFWIRWRYIAGKRGLLS